MNPAHQHRENQETKLSSPCWGQLNSSTTYLPDKTKPPEQVPVQRNKQYAYNLLSNTWRSMPSSSKFMASAYLHLWLRHPTAWPQLPPPKAQAARARPVLSGQGNYEAELTQVVAFLEQTDLASINANTHTGMQVCMHQCNGMECNALYCI